MRITLVVLRDVRPSEYPGIQEHSFPPKVIANSERNGSYFAVASLSGAPALAQRSCVPIVGLLVEP